LLGARRQDPVVCPLAPDTGAGATPGPQGATSADGWAGRGGGPPGRWDRWQGHRRLKCGAPGLLGTSHGSAYNPAAWCHRLAWSGVPTGQALQPMEAGLLGPGLCPLTPGGERPSGWSEAACPATLSRKAVAERRARPHLPPEIHIISGPTIPRRACRQPGGAESVEEISCPQKEQACVRCCRGRLVQIRLIVDLPCLF
jgi:hypothetical protein